MPPIFEKLDKIKPVYDVVDKILLFICKLFLIVDILITSMAVAGRYISFIPWGGDARGLTLRGFKYPLGGAVLSHAQSLGISNELSDERGEVFLAGGTLIMAESADG